MYVINTGHTTDFRKHLVECLMTVGTSGPASRTIFITIDSCGVNETTTTTFDIGSELNHSTGFVESLVDGPKPSKKANEQNYLKLRKKRF